MSNPQHDALAQYTNQMQFALDHYIPHGLSYSQFDHILIGGMGGSGIGGQLAKNLFMLNCPIPIITLAHYRLPSFVSEKTLIILSSYSGNTEETLALFETAQHKGCHMLCISSGGKLHDLAASHGIRCYPVLTGFQPRMALGFSLTYLLLILGELTAQDMLSPIKEAIETLNEEGKSELQAYANQIFQQIKQHTKSKFIIITDPDYEALGIRFAQQIQENAKLEAFVHVIPEMNHNVIETYYGKLDAVYFLIHSHTHERIEARFEFINNLLEVENHKVIPITTHAFGIKEMYELNYALDWLSLLVADQRRVDSLNVPNIASLKSFLDEVGNLS